MTSFSSPTWGRGMRLPPEGSYCSFAYSALACLRMETSGSASFQSARTSWYADLVRSLSPLSKCALPSCKYASAPTGRQNGSAMFENLLELCGRLSALLCSQTGFAMDINPIQTSEGKVIDVEYSNFIGNNRCSSSMARAGAPWFGAVGSVIESVCERGADLSTIVELGAVLYSGRRMMENHG